MTIEGSLDSVDIQDVAQLLNINHSTGSLVIETPAFKGVLLYQDGEIINAEVEGMSGEAAAYVLLGQHTGSFHFRIGDHHAQRVIERSIHDLILEAARRQDTIKKIRTSISHDNIIYLPLVDVRIPQQAKDFSEMEQKILANLDGQIDIQSVIHNQKISSFEVLYIIYDLEQRGAIKRVNIYKLLKVSEFKKIFGTANEVYVSDKLVEDWVKESMTYANCEYVEIRTQGGAFGQMPMVSKGNISPGTILIPKKYMKDFGVSVDDNVLVKPVIST